MTAEEEILAKKDKDILALAKKWSKRANIIETKTHTPALY